MLMTGDGGYVLVCCEGDCSDVEMVLECLTFMFDGLAMSRNFIVSSIVGHMTMVLEWLLQDWLGYYGNSGWSWNV